jgi:uncharacterized DUF497 family protein
MDYEWDEEKARTNARKHDVDFADAVGVFDDPHALSMRDATPNEERFIAVGADLLGRILVVVYTYRGERIRIISARPRLLLNAKPTNKVPHEARI